MFKAMTEDTLTPRRLAFDEALVDQTIEDIYGHTADGLERQSAVMRDWLLDDDADLQLIDDHGVPLLERHPIVNADRGNDADIEELAASMEAKGWCEGVGGVPFAVRQEGCKDARKMWMIGGASRVEAWVKAYRRNPTNKKLLLTFTKRLKHCHVYKPQTPLAVLKWLKEFHNSYHTGLKRTLREALSDAKASALHGQCTRQPTRSSSARVVRVPSLTDQCGQSLWRISSGAAGVPLTRFSSRNRC